MEMKTALAFKDRRAWRSWLEKNDYSFFQKLAPSQQRLYLAWVTSAKKDETRRRRLAEMISKLARGQKLGLK